MNDNTLNDHYPRFPSAAIDQCWICLNSGQSIYFYNVLTKETTYSVPPSFVNDSVSFFQFRKILGYEEYSETLHSRDNRVNIDVNEDLNKSKSEGNIGLRNGINEDTKSDRNENFSSGDDDLNESLIRLYNNALINTGTQIKLKVPFNSRWTLVKLTNEEFFFWNSRENYSVWEVPPLNELAPDYHDKVETTIAQQHQIRDTLKTSFESSLRTIHDSRSGTDLKDTPEERFKQLLRESNITKLSTFASVMPKIKNDPRFHGLNNKARKVVFMNFIRQLMKNS